MHIPFLNALTNYLQGDGAVILPEIELTLFGLGILLIDFTLGVKERYLNAGLALAGTVFSAYTVWKLRIPVAANRALFGFHDSVVVDPFFLFFATLFLAATALVILLSVKFLEIEQEQEGEYYALLLFACVGMMFMASGFDLIVMFLGLETMALSFYVLTGFLRRDKRSNEASLKYVLLGAFSSGILAYGFSLLYGLSASTNIDTISEMLGQRDAFVISILHNPQPATAQFDPFLLQLLPVLAFVFVAVGLFFKIAAVPFHQWAPDVYEGAPTPVTAYVSVASKIASFALLLRLSAMIGIGYYLLAYIFMTAGAFAVIIVLRQKGLIGEELEDLNGLYYRNPAAALLLLVFMLSLAGIPPTAGFMGKYFIFLSLIETHHPVLAVFAVLYIVPALYYYFRIIVHAWLKQPGEAPRPVMSSAQAVALGVTVFVTLAAGLYPQPFIRFAEYALGR